MSAPSDTLAIAPDILADRRPVLRKALSCLPDELLEPLSYALHEHRDQLEPDRLYAGPGGGGCAIGVMLQELFPAAYSPSRWAFWRRRTRRSVRDENPALAKEFPRLAHIEGVFDSTHLRLSERQPQRSCQDIGRQVGLWIAAEAQSELDERAARARDGMFVPEDWSVQAPAPAAPKPPACRDRQLVSA